MPSIDLQPPLSAGARQKATQALRSLLVRITTLTLALTGLLGLAAFPGVAQVSAHTTTSQQTSNVTTQTSTVMRQYVFARSTNNTLVVRWAVFGSTVWSPWQSLGVQMDSAPSVSAMPGSDLIEGAYRHGRDILHFEYNVHTGKFSQETLDHMCTHSFGGFCGTGDFTSAPAILSEGSGVLDMYALAGSTLFHKVSTLQTLFGNPQPIRTWSDWASLGVANSVGDPTVIATPGRTDVFIRSTDNHIYDKTAQNNKWTSWQDRGGLFTSGPAVMSPGNGVIKVFARNLQGGTDVTTFSNGKWIFWTQLDTTASGQDGVVPAVTVSGISGYAYDLFFELPGGFLDLHSVSALGNAIQDHLLASGGTLINSTPAAVVVSF